MAKSTSKSLTPISREKQENLPIAAEAKPHKGPIASFARKFASPVKSKIDPAKSTGIRPAQISDSLAIQTLLEELGYPDTKSFIVSKLETMLPDPDDVILVYEHNRKVEGFVAVHFNRQVGTEGDFARITYFAVKDGVRSKGIGGALENYVTELAQKRNCDRIEVHCHSRRSDAHRFYFRQGYKESPKYFIKSLVTK